MILKIIIKFYRWNSNIMLNQILQVIIKIIIKFLTIHQHFFLSLDLSNHQE